LARLKINPQGMDLVAVIQ